MHAGAQTSLIRDPAAFRDMLAVPALARLDIVLSNAGIVRLHADTDDPAQLWQDVVGTNLTGGLHVVNARLRSREGQRRPGQRCAAR